VQDSPPSLDGCPPHMPAEVLAGFGEVNAADMDPAIPGDLNLQPAIAVALVDHAAGPAHKRTQAQPQDRPKHRVDPGEGITEGVHGRKYERAASPVG